MVASRIREAKARIEEMGGYSSSVMEEVEGIACDVGDAVQALLELAEAAVEAGEGEELSRLWVAAERWKEVKRP